MTEPKHSPKMQTNLFYRLGSSRHEILLDGVLIGEFYDNPNQIKEVVTACNNYPSVLKQRDQAVECVWRIKKTLAQQGRTSGELMKICDAFLAEQEAEK